MSDLIFGKLIDGEAQRDAVHIAVAPVIADCKLYPAQAVALIAGTDRACETNGKCIGIVDPYLTKPVYPGERFWLFLYQNTVTGMRHHWAHPAFEEAEMPETPVKIDERSASDAWLRDLAGELGMSYSELISAAVQYVGTGEVTIQHGGEWWRGRFDPVREKFWRHYEIATGNTVEDHAASIFCCSC